MEELSRLTWREITVWIFEAMYFYLPAVAANMAPVIAAKLVPGNWPIWEERLGKNKTWRGFVFGITAAGVVIWIQKDLALTRFGSALSVLDYKNESVIVMAFLFGGGALLGDTIKSFIKRLKKRPAGSPWYPMDQIDFIISAWVCMWLAGYPAPVDLFVTALLLAVVIQPLCRKGFYKIVTAVADDLDWADT